MKSLVKEIPVIGEWVSKAYHRMIVLGRKRDPFVGSKKYWETRYAAGGDSGVGSYSKFADFKAEILNAFVEKHSVQSVIEFGCGDGNQLSLANYPNYMGFDISETIVAKCNARFASDQTKTFAHMLDYKQQKAELALSLDVIFHLVEDEVFEPYMQTLFRASSRFVIVYSSDRENNAMYKGTPVRHRKFSKWVRRNAPEWKLIQRIPNRYPYKGDYEQGSFADFFIYERVLPC